MSDRREGLEAIAEAIGVPTAVDGEALPDDRVMDNIAHQATVLQMTIINELALKQVALDELAAAEARIEQLEAAVDSAVSFVYALEHQKDAVIVRARRSFVAAIAALDARSQLLPLDRGEEDGG